jgi:hypothetical protein
MSNQNPFEQVQRYFEEFQGDINIMDEQIDIKLQMEYFDMSKELKKEPLGENWLEISNSLFDDDTNYLVKKKLLVQLASVDDVKAYRIIERFVSQASSDIRHWAMMAQQESRMVIQSKLLDHSQILISTGLGGKGNKLRYFFALFSKNKEVFTDYQQKIIKGEFEFVFKKGEAEIESIEFVDDVSLILSLVPIHTPIQNIFTKAVNECNQYGGFVRENCIITNVRKMNIEEVRAFLIKNESNQLPEIDDIL